MLIFCTIPCLLCKNQLPKVKYQLKRYDKIHSLTYTIFVSHEQANPNRLHSLRRIFSLDDICIWNTA